MSVWDTDESPWRQWCIWSFRIHVGPPCLTWLIKRDGARLPVLDLSPSAWRLQSPEKRSSPRLHLCWLLIELIFGQFYHIFFISFGGRRAHSLCRGATWSPQDQNKPYSKGSKVDKLLYGGLCRAEWLTHQWMTSAALVSWDWVFFTLSTSVPHGM